jgi:hypothetical protein
MALLVSFQLSWGMRGQQSTDIAIRIDETDLSTVARYDLEPFVDFFWRIEAFIVWDIQPLIQENVPIQGKSEAETVSVVGTHASLTARNGRDLDDHIGNSR